MRPHSKRAIVLALCLPFLNGCATRPTVDGGRPLNAEMVADMRAFGDAAIELRPAIVRSAFAADSGCDNQYELPFDAMTIDARDRGAPFDIALDSGERVTVTPLRLEATY